MKHPHRYPAVPAALAVLSALLLTACKTPSIDQVKASLEVVNIKTKWVVKEYKQWPQPKLVLVPEVQFQVRNKTAEPIKYINFNGVFQKPGDNQNLGDNFLAAIRNEPVPPGGLSPVVTLKSNFGREGRNLEHFKLFPQELEYNVKIYAQFGGSRHALLGEFPVSRDIDFKEDQPVHMDGKKIEKSVPVVPLKPEPKK
jgi:hypothetical protein